MRKTLILTLFLMLLPFSLYAQFCGYNERCSVTFLRDGKTISNFKTGIAETDETRIRGLMFCNSMEKGKGLLFVFNFPGPKSFWMKNTLIPLDLVFISKDFQVISVRKGVPYSLDHITERADVKYVLEVNAGEASGLKTFDRVKIEFR